VLIAQEIVKLTFFIGFMPVCLAAQGAPDLHEFGVCVLTLDRDVLSETAQPVPEKLQPVPQPTV
jgi:hypothetical protein